METRPGPGAYGFASKASKPVRTVLSSAFTCSFTGRRHIPARGPLIVAANHLSLVDPVLVTAGVGRLVRYLALDELYGIHRLLDWSLRYFGSVPIPRNRWAVGSLRQAVEILEEGDVLGIFPEGARARYWGERTIKRGAAWLSLATGAPVLPCSISGSEGTLSLIEPGFHAPAVRISLHPPIYPDTYIDREDPLGSMMNDWASVIDGRIGHWKREE